MAASPIVDAFRLQARGCAGLGSALYADLLERAADDVEAGGPLADLFADWTGHPVLDALPLRLMGALHGEALAGRAPALARFYPTLGGVANAEAAWPVLRALVAERVEALRPRLAQHVQTNEVQRAAALLGGFLCVARDAKLPLRILEIGSSAGLNQLWDRHHYVLGPHRWGDPAARLRVEVQWSGPPPPLDARVAVASRAGCDVAPIDLEDAEARRRLESFVWADQPERLAALRSAIALAREAGVRVERAAAADWLDRELAHLPGGQTTLVFQSVVWWYIPKPEQERITARIASAGDRVGPDARLAWLRMEGVRAEFAEVRLLTWPGGEDRLLARAHWHGRSVEWCETADAGAAQ